MRAHLEDFAGVDDLGSRNKAFIEHRTARGAPAGDEIVVSSLEGLNELSRSPVEHNTPAYLAGMDERLARGAVDREIDKHALIGRIHIPVVGGHDLEVPSNFAGLDIQRDDAVCVQ